MSNGTSALTLAPEVGETIIPASTSAATTSVRADYARRIRERAADAIEAMLDVGDLLIAAKAELPSKVYAQLVREDLQWTIRHADRLIAIASNTTIRTHVSELPPRVGTLAVLAPLAPERFESAIQTGEISPTTTRREAQALVASEITTTAPPTSPTKQHHEPATAARDQHDAREYTDQHIDPERELLDREQLEREAAELLDRLRDFAERRWPEALLSGATTFGEQHDHRIAVVLVAWEAARHCVNRRKRASDERARVERERARAAARK